VVACIGLAAGIACVVVNETIYSRDAAKRDAAYQAEVAEIDRAARERMAARR
jgi:hypothetical protein